MIVEIAGIEFPITLDMKKSQLSGTVPSELILRELRLELDKFDGHIVKDTDFDRWRVDEIDVESLTEGGCTVRVSANLKHREKLVSALGKTYYSPWASLAVHGTAEFAVSVRENILEVGYRSHDIKGRKWYSEVVGLLANDLFANKIASAVDKALSQFNGVSIASFLKEGQIVKGGIVKTPLPALLADISASVDIAPGGVNFLVDLPAEVIVT